MEKRFIEYLKNRADRNDLTTWRWNAYKNVKPTYNRIDLSLLKLQGNIEWVMLQMDIYFDKCGYSNFLRKYIIDCKNADLSWETENELFQKAVENITTNDTLWLVKMNL